MISKVYTLHTEHIIHTVSIVPAEHIELNIHTEYIDHTEYIKPTEHIELIITAFSPRI